MHKRQREEDAESKRPKKKVQRSDAVPLKAFVPKPAAPAPAAEIDFPRGGGSSFTPLETKAIRAEALQELQDEQIFKDGVKQKVAKGQRKRASLNAPNSLEVDKDRLRVEHLNYKRLAPGQRILCQIVDIRPLALLVSLPNQLLGHVPATHISSLLTERLERVDAEEADSTGNQEEDDDVEEKSASASSDVPDLADMFTVGQYLTAVVEEVRPSGPRSSIDFSKARDEVTKAAKRAELSIDPEKVNAGVAKRDLVSGFNISAVVKSVEDHGYILDLGIPSVSGFLSLKEARKGPKGNTTLSVGQVVNTSVLKMSENGRIVTLAIEAAVVKSASVSEVSSVNSVLPGALVPCLVTAVFSWGLNVQLLGFFGGTLDLFHLPATNIEERYKIGQKIKARVLWDVSSNSPKTFALSVLPHVVHLGTDGPVVNKEKKQAVREAFPVGTVLDAVKVRRVESEWGLVCEGPNGVQGFVHISHVSDEHVPSLSDSSGLWKIGSTHRARVIGFSLLDGLLQLSLKPSVIDQRYLRPTDLAVGEIIKGTVKSLSELGLFVTIADGVDGVVWPLHYSDIKLKNPERKFKIGNPVKCRVLNVDEERNRVTLTLKKSLIDNELPILTRVEEAKIGLVTPGVVAKILPKSVIINYFGGLRGIVPLREASEERLQSAEGFFSIGQVIRTLVLAIDTTAPSPRIVASIRQAAPNYVQPVSVEGIPLGSVISESRVVEVQKDNVAVDLLPTNARALVSINNLAARRGVSAAKLRTELAVGDKLNDSFTVVTRNIEKNFVIVSANAIPSSSKTKTAAKERQDGDISYVDFNTLKEGDIVKGRVTAHTLKHGLGCAVRISNLIVGSLHPTDAADDLKKGFAASYPPAIDAVLDFAIVSIDKQRKRLVLSTRPSRVKHTGKEKVVDPEITDIGDLQRGQSVRGVVKSVANAGLFVSLGRSIDARVQIKELFDDFVKDWKAHFRVGDVVQAKVLKVDLERHQVELTMRSRDLSQDDAPMMTIEDLVEGNNVDGIIKKVELYGLFIEIKGTKTSGLCHKSELSDNKKSDVSRALKLFKEGDSVRARILTVDVEKRRVNFGLKPSYFVDDPAAASNEGVSELAEDSSSDHEESDVAEDDEVTQYGDDDGDDDDGDEAGEDQSDALLVDAPCDENSGSEEADGDVNMGDAVPSVPLSLPPTMLQLRRGFDWGTKADAPENYSDASSADDESDAGASEAPKSRRKKKKHEVQKDLTAQMHTKAPESTADFERLLLGSPNSSFLWIQYMSFQLQLSEIDKAREIGRHAISAINFREEQERLNVWIARLNLENSYGTNETLEATFRDAAKYHDAKHMHLRLAAILEQTDKHEKAEEMFRRTTKKFGQSSKVWVAFGEHYFKRKMLEDARKLLARSLQSLEKRKHIKTIAKFAQMEYKFGDPERGKTIFEGIIDSHPKRLDLWSVYVDMEVCQKDIQTIRLIFDRLFLQKLSSKKAKFFFKKWLALEKSIGDDAGTELVKSRAIAWTQGSTAIGTSVAS